VVIGSSVDEYLVTDLTAVYTMMQPLLPPLPSSSAPTVGAVVDSYSGVAGSTEKDVAKRSIDVC